MLELNKKLEESHKVQELATHADCQANVVELEQELEGVRDSAARSLASQQEEIAKTVATMDTYNGQVANLKQDLIKRNERFQQLTTALETTELNMKKLMEVVKN